MDAPVVRRGEKKKQHVSAAALGLFTQMTHLSVQQHGGDGGDDVAPLGVDVEHVGGRVARRLPHDVVAQRGVVRGRVVGVERHHCHHRRPCRGEREANLASSCECIFSVVV